MEKNPAHRLIHEKGTSDTPFSTPESAKGSGDKPAFEGQPFLRNLDALPNKVIRREPLADFSVLFRGIEDPLEAVKKSEALLSELDEGYGITVVPISVVVGKGDAVSARIDSVPSGESRSYVYIITEKVEGYDPGYLLGERKKGITRRLEIEERLPLASERITTIPEEVRSQTAQELATLFVSLSQYLQDKSETSGHFLFDIFRGGQYAYGKIKNGTDNHMYLIDTDLHRVERITSNNILDSLADFAETVCVAMNVLGSYADFAPAKKSIEELLSGIPEAIQKTMEEEVRRIQVSLDRM
ncbi:hypothetical protein L0Y40_01500 [Candidatus Wolfebacteria bacterium]|nr:hypothetical protein [Candidatus Wolfebacteria bacterium]